MQLDLFGAEAAPTDQEGGPEHIASLLVDMPFGPVNKIEAQANRAFMAEGDSATRLIRRDAYEAMLQSGRIAQIVEEAAFDEHASISGLDGRRSKLKQHLVPLILDRLNGMELKHLAEKYDMTTQGVQHVLNRPSTRKFVAKLLAEYARGLGDVRERIMHHATEAVDTVVDLMRNGVKEETKQKSAFALLRMAGYDNNITTAVTINEQPLDSSVIEKTNKLLEALQESSQARRKGYNKYVEASGTVVEAKEIAVVEPPKGLKKVASA